MIDAAYLSTFAAIVRSHADVRLDPGLDDSEIAVVEKRCGVRFRPDLRAVLQFVLPVGKQFPDWRSGSEEDLWSRINLPLEEIWSGVEHNNIWPSNWCSRPVDAQERFAKVKGLIESAPRLFPIWSHRYIPAEPSEFGNPVFSIHQTDITYCGNDLPDYFHHEFGVPLPTWAAQTPKPILVREHSLS